MSQIENEDPSMGKRMALAFALSFLIFFGYMHFYGKKTQPQPPASTTQEQKQSTPSDQAVPSEEKNVKAQAVKETTPLPPEEEVTLESPLTKVTFSTWGASIKSLLLKESKLIRGEPVPLVQFQNPSVQPGSIERFSDSPEQALGAYKIVEKGPDYILFEAQYRKISVQKKFTLRDNYTIELEISILNQGKKERSLYRGYDLCVGSMQEKNPDDSLRPLEINSFLLGGEGAYLKKPVRKIRERSVEDQELSWACLKSKYYTLILKPTTTETTALITDSVEENFKRYYTCALRISTPILKPGETHQAKFFIYAGPRDYDLLKSFGFHFESLMEFEGIWGKLGYGLTLSLRTLHRLLHNYGLAIIVLTILLKLIFYPLSALSLRSMKEMQALKPQLDILRKKYKDNPKKMQQETMTLYREHNVKPLAGCLPMLVQIPIFIAFYRILMNSIELRGEHFLWIKDLAHADTLFRIGTFPINILPILNGGTMFWQQKLTPTDPSQQSLKFMMPIMITVFFYGLPSGLILYWLVTTLITVLQQYQIQKKS